MIHFLIYLYTCFESFINKHIINICDKGYVKISLIFSILYGLFAFVVLYICYILLILIVLLFYLVRKKKLKLFFSFLYKHVFLKLLFIFFIKYINGIFLIPLYLLYKIIIYIHNNKLKKPLNLVSLLIYVGQFLYKPINGLKQKILIYADILET